MVMRRREKEEGVGKTDQRETVARTFVFWVVTVQFGVSGVRLNRI